MNIPTIGSLVKGGTKAQFQFYRDGELWYKVGHPAWECKEEEGKECQGWFEFPVPISDTGTGIFEKEMKVILLMRWIRKYIEKLKTWEEEKAKCSQE